MARRRGVGMSPAKVSGEGVVAIVPARGGSKRLPRKNVYPVGGIPMLLWTLRECRRSKELTRVVVSTEDKEISRLCAEDGIEVVQRPARLARDDTPKMATIVHAAKALGIGETYFPEIVVSLQPNNPEFLAADLDSAIHFFRTEVFPGQPVREVISLGTNLIQNGCFRIMTPRTVFQRTLSMYVGAVITDYLDVHTLADVQIVEQKLAKQGRLG